MFRWWAFWRRVQYGTGFLIIFGLIFYVLYARYAYVAPTCFDGKKNQDEAGKDCGGVCVRVCPFEIESLEVSWVESFKIVDGQYNAVAYVENPNDFVGTPNLEYVIRLFDGNDEVAVRTGFTQMPPNGLHPIFEGRIYTDESVNVTRTEIEFGENTIWLHGEKGKENFTLINRELLSVDSKPRLNALVENKELVEARDLEIVATIFNAAGQPVTASQTFIEYFSPDSREEVVFTWPRPISKTIVSCEIPTDVALAIDLSGSMNDDGGEPPQPISSVLSAAESFVDRLGSNDQISVVTYATNAEVVDTLSKNHDATETIISNLSISPEEERGSTNTGEALMRLEGELNSVRHNENARKIAILLSDGLATAGGENPERYALEEAQKLKATDVQLFTIGLGENVNEAFLRQLASSNNHYYKAPTADDVDEIYQNITDAICEVGPAVIEIVPKIQSKFPNWP